MRIRRNNAATLVGPPVSSSGAAATSTVAGPAEETLLRLSGVSYMYPNGLEAVDDIDLELRRGEIISIVGPSGCGKSTLLSLIAGLIDPVSGSIEWSDDAAPDSRQPGQRLSMVFQRDTVFPWRTVEKNVQFGMECMDLSKPERDEWTDSLLRIANLEQFRKAYPRALSGGMRRRVGLIMGLAVRPSVLLLDEPFGALDEPTRVELTADVLNLTYNYGVSVVLVTHDLGEAISVADRIIVMSNRPARIRRVVEVGHGHDRDVFKLRESPEFAEQYAQLWHELWSAIREVSPDAAPPEAPSGRTPAARQPTSESRRR